MGTAIKHTVPDRLKPSSVILVISYCCLGLLTSKPISQITYTVLMETFKNPAQSILTSKHCDAQGWASQCLDVKIYRWQLKPVWHRMLYRCTHMATVAVKWLKHISTLC